MPFTEEDQIIIKHYRQTYGWGSKKILSNLGDQKEWTRRGIDYLIRKIDRTGSHKRIEGSGRPKSARNEENQNEVEELILSQEDGDGNWQKHESPRAIAIKLGISKNSVYRIAREDLDLNIFHRVKGQKLTLEDHQKRVVRSKRMLRLFTRDKLKKTFFSDESIFTIEGRYNPKNDVIYTHEKKKADVDESRLHHDRSNFPRSIMVSGAVSMLGKTSLYIIEQGVRMDSGYYCENLLSELIPEMSGLSAGDFIFQQDGARCHTSKYTMKYLDENLPEDADVLLPEDWPPHSPDLNPLDYSIWSSLARKVYKVKIRDVHHLCERLAVAWDELSQQEINRVIKSFRKRLKCCRDAGGRRFEYKLK